MDSRMRDVSGSRGRGAGRQPRRSDPYDRSQRLEGSRMASASAWDNAVPAETSPSYPPAAISIKGSGGPYVVVVGNVAKGTSLEDIKLTLEPYGEVLYVKERPPPSLNYPSISFEVFFARKEDGQAACHSLNGCLADGRVLSVAAATPETVSSAFSNFNGQVSAAARQRVGETGNIVPGPAPVPRGAPVAGSSRTHVGTHAAPAAGRELMGGSNNHINSGRAKGQNTSGPQPFTGGNARKTFAPAAGAAGAKAKAKAVPTAPAPKSLQNRLGLGPTAAEKARTEAIKKAQKKGTVATRNGNARGVAVAVSGAAGSGSGGKKGGAAALPKSLKERIAVPLAERLAAASTSASDPATAEAKKRKREAYKAKLAAKKAAAKGGMDVD
ncbi:hypothetical protein K437DRAFT_255924 [Tilletiaria anomala UBC 951]|uniref:RRM domain-containing protein n=1 Tax=Tilletiaria anomala (strain ATCC 24038 / CBS 436.72 / UBC 951) TaxID=1037660 RepID=A0A066W059_TILAU|nr:uncharacterized protein K437DRAFT_255924 [Tilletiaria anomala UBC 951]KDN47136.1 hypothetical protein K437DRAFT_255924 [Tilletiaria anomala UBC 951]